MRACRFSSATFGSVPAKRVGEGRAVGDRQVLDRQLQEPDAEPAGQDGRVVAIHAGGVARRHRDGGHRFRPDGVRRDGERESRIDTARQPEHGSRKAVLADVVGGSQHEGAVDLRLRRQRLRRRPRCERSRLGARRSPRTDDGHPSCVLARPPRRRRVGGRSERRARGSFRCAPGGRRRPSRIGLSQLAGHCRVEIHDEHLLFERRAAGEDRSIRSDDQTVAVEDQLVLAADGVAECQEAAQVAAAGREQRLPLAALALVIG